MAVKILRLMSGEEVLGDVFYDEEKETYLIKDPVNDIRYYITIHSH